MVISSESGDIPSPVFQSCDTLAVCQLDVYTELPELLVKELHELCTVNSFRESGIILDFTCICCKTADKRLFHEKCLKACTACIQSSCHTAGTAADDNHIIIFNSFFHIKIISSLTEMSPPWARTFLRGKKSVE